MGTLMGHVVPGSFFICFSLWWCYNLTKRYFNHPHRYRNTTACNPMNHRMPWESLVKIACTAAGIIGETWTGFNRDLVFVNPMPNGQHIAMYSFFMFASIVEAIIHVKNPGLDAKHVMKNLDYFLMIVSFGVEGFLFANHLHGRDMFDIQVHTCLVYSIKACVLAGIIELCMDKTDIRPALLRCVTILWQGIWFCHLGFTLFPPFSPKPDYEGNHVAMMVQIIWFVAHLGVAILVVGAITSINYCRRRTSGIVRNGTRDSKVTAEYNEVSLDLILSESD